jgi:excisionase family DNA binding protein
MSVAELPLTMTVEEAARAIGCSRGLAYEAARRGELPTVRLGRRLFVPRARLLEMLGESPLETQKPDSSPGQGSCADNRDREYRRPPAA